MSAEQRSPLHRMRPCPGSTKAVGMRSRSASSSVENRGHSFENEQHAPQLWQMADVCASSVRMGASD
jgi:hypothetical protein